MFEAVSVTLEPRHTEAEATAEIGSGEETFTVTGVLALSHPVALFNSDT